MSKQTPEQMAATMIANMPEKTGKSLDAWLAIAAKSGLGKHGELVKYLKADHGMTHGFANLVAHRHFNADAGVSAGDDLVSAQYSGPKAALRPIYESICVMVGKFGKDVEIAPKKTYVSLRRSKQFALIQPSTKDRIDVGINLRGEPAADRLEESGSFNKMVSHRVRITDKEQVDAELRGWLKKAYDAA